MAIPKYSRAAVLRTLGTPVQIEDVPIPSHIEPGALLVKIECGTVCGTDVHLVDGTLNRKIDLPVIVGHEMTGRIVAFGDGATHDSIGQDLKLGDRVVWTRTNCGHCYMCTVGNETALCENARVYMYENIEQPPHLLGGFSEYGYVLPDAGRIRVPNRVDSALASMASCALRSVVHAVQQLPKINHTDTVVVQGLGPLGLLATGLIRTLGVKKIIAIGGPKNRIDLARQFGADRVLAIEETSSDDRRAVILGMTQGRGADLVMEFAGHPVALNEGLDLLRRGGTYLTVGQLGNGVAEIKPSVFVHKNINLIGSLGGTAKDYWGALSFIEMSQDKIPFHSLISNHYALSEVNSALEAMRKQQEIKPLIEL